jgi:hypothetical protein
MRIITDDGHEVATGDRVLAFYATPVQWGTIWRIDSDGWADVDLDDGTRQAFNGSRLAAQAPTSGPAAIGDDPLDDDDQDDDGQRYTIWRFSFNAEREFVRTGLTLDEAREHCHDEATHGNGWFDGYEAATEYDDPSAPYNGPMRGESRFHEYDGN